MLIPQQSEREDTTTWTAPAKRTNKLILYNVIGQNQHTAEQESYPSWTAAPLFCVQLWTGLRAGNPHHWPESLSELDHLFCRGKEWGPSQCNARTYMQRKKFSLCSHCQDLVTKSSVMQVCHLQTGPGWSHWPLGNHIGSTESKNVDGREASLSARWDKHHGWFGGRVLHDGVVYWLSHGQQASLSMTHIETLNRPEQLTPV